MKWRIEKMKKELFPIGIGTWKIDYENFNNDIDALVHSIEAYGSMMATEFTDGLALEAIKTIFEYLPTGHFTHLCVVSSML